MKSFIYPLIEETRADLSSHTATLFRAPICQIFDVRISKDHEPPKDLYYHLFLMTVRDTENGEVEYEPEVGDLIALTDVRPKNVNDLNRPKTSYLLAFVQGENEISNDLLILSSKPIVYEKNEQKRGTLFAVSLTNLTTNTRIWNALNLDLEGANMNIIRKVLQPSHASEFFLRSVLGVAARFMGLVQHTLKYDTYGLGDVLLFGNDKRMKIQDCEELHDVFLSKRVASLAACFAPFSGWKGSIDSMILMFEDPEELYSLYIGKKNSKGKDSKDDNGDPGKGILSQMPDEEEEVKDEETLKGNIKKIVKEPSKKGKEMSCQEGRGSDNADAAENLLTFEEFLAGDNGVEEAKKKIKKLSMCRTDFLKILKALREAVSLPDFTEESTIRDFCLKHATLIFCTVSSSAKLLTEGMTPLELLVIDEAAQLKECESAIPLQLNGLRHAILVGDKRQLQAMVQSKVCFSDEFCNSMVRIKHVEIRKKVVSLLLELSNGWRQPSWEKTDSNMAGVSSQLLEQYNVNGYLSLIWSVDVLKKASMHIQVIKVWDILPVYKIPHLARHLNVRFGNYTPNTIKLCKYRRVEGKLVLPMTWPLDSDALTLAFYDQSESLTSQLGALNIRN
ncbi:hypothetical protein RJ640_017986 [Escallonia rubra]|uniref:DNA2/NAM7 helicase helicase domain-containing protein n=1 Tax=Escallonia rubra TaxID=112253 RepID=A0AA88RGP2_9ASTE|nr:hypothetical protein RJ640_017986 [Escallonia rubra]